MRPNPTLWPRRALLLLGVLGLAAGLLTGLARLGFALPLAAQAGGHALFMLGGLFGVVIGLERAVALGAGWAYLAPLASGLGTLGLLAGAGRPALLGFALGSAVLVASSLRAAQRQPETFMGVLVLGAFCAVLGHVLAALGAPLRSVLLPQFAFLVLTIAGERLELSRYLPRPAWAQPVLAGILLALLAALALPEGLDARAFGATLLALAAWLGRHDLARRTLHQTGLPRFVAVALLAGYAQLALAGALLLVAGLQPGAPGYDAALHALGLGFVFSMVFGHAPLIGPALLRVASPYSAALYLPLALLHASVLARLFALAAGEAGLRRQAGLGSALAILLFLLLMLWGVWRRFPPASHVHKHPGAAPR